MAYYPDVHPGDEVENSAERENDIRHLLNNSDGFRDGFNRAKLNSVRIPVWNLTPYTINAGALVYVVVTSEMCGDAFPVAPLNYNPYDPQFFYDDAPFGVLEKTLKAKDTGSLVLSGTVEVSITAGTAGNFAKPVPTGGFERGREGFRILHLNSAGTSAFILVGDYRMPDYQAGVGINKAELSGGTISTALVQGSNVTLTPDPETGAITISATGGTSGGGGLDIPPYSALTFGGGAPDYGLGHTFILAVKAGNVGFWDEGGGAVGKWTNKNGTTSVSLTNKTAYNASEDGWLRISVVDDGSMSGECLSFFSQTGGFPLYKYGTFGSTASGICYPDYYQLGKVTGGTISGDVRGTGTTYLLPVYAGLTVKWYSSGSNVYARYAPGVGVSVTGATPATIQKDTDFQVLANGWVRISVIDEGTIENSCLRFYVNDTDVSSYLSLYRYNKFQRLRGDGETIQVNGDVISYIGGGGGGGGSGFFPAWSTTGHTDVIPITDGSGQGYTANADGWLFACAFFDPLEDRLKYKNYDAHVVVGDARMKIAELKLPGGTPFIKVGNVKYTRDANNDWSWDPYVEHPYYSYFAWKDNNDTTIYTSNVAPVVGESTYTYDSEEEDFIDNEAEVEETNTATYAVCIGSGSPIPVKSGAVIKFVVLADGYTFYSRRTPPPCFCVFYSSNPPSTP